MRDFYKFAVIGLIAVSSLIGSYFGGRHIGREQGVAQGIADYHFSCFNTGGFVINEENGTVVQCRGITTIPEPERKQFFNEAFGNS